MPRKKRKPKLEDVLAEVTLPSEKEMNRWADAFIFARKRERVLGSTKKKRAIDNMFAWLDREVFKFGKQKNAAILEVLSDAGLWLTRELMGRLIQKRFDRLRAKGRV